MSSAMDFGDAYLAQKGEWVAAFLTAQSKFPKIGKGTTVDTGSFSYRYATLPDIIEAVNPVLRKEGLVLAQSVTSSPGAVGVETRLYHKAGHVEVFGPILISVSGDAKAAGSAITYARRYALCAALGIAPDEDDDDQQASAPAKPEPAELTPWKWLVGEWSLFKHWTEDQRVAAAKQAFDTYAYTSATLTRPEAENVLEFMRNAYETEAAEQAKLDV